MTLILLIRADASAEIGTGHVLRCLALAQAWQDGGGEVVYASSSLPDLLHDRLLAERCTVHPLAAAAGSEADARTTAELARSLGARWVVLDGYSFNSAYQRFLSEAGVRTLMLDDDGTCGRYRVDVILNQNVGAKAALYTDRGRESTLLLGTRFALLRRELAGREFRRVPPLGVARRLVVSMGGADPALMTEKVLEALKQLRDLALEVRVLVGAANRRQGEISSLARALDQGVEIEHAVTDMSQIWTAADMAIAAAGSTCWELCYTGVPAIVISVAPNQDSLAAGLEAEGAACSLGWHLNVDVDTLAKSVRSLACDAERRWAMTQAGQSLVDGRGAERVVDFLATGRSKGSDLGDHTSGANLTPVPRMSVALRPAEISDAETLLTWRNDLATRDASRQQALITAEQHQGWLERSLQNPDRQLFIAVIDGRPVGTVRLDRSANGTVVSWTVAPDARGKGIGSSMVGCAIANLHGCVRAEIKQGNAPSIRIAERFGMHLERREGEVLHFLLEKPRSR